MKRGAMLRILRDNEVRFVRSGRRWLVSIAELERKVPPLWEGIKTVMELRQLLLEDA
jgi:hypothetical protein